MSYKQVMLQLRVELIQIMSKWKFGNQNLAVGFTQSLDTLKWRIELFQIEKENVITTVYWLSEWVTDELNEFLEWLFATKIK